MKKTRVQYLRILAAALIAAVLALDMAFILLPDRDYSDVENRNLQRFPALSLRAITSGRFESRFDDYVADQFPLRNAWIRAKTFVDRLLGRREANGVFLCSDGYLIRGFTPPAESNFDETVTALRDFSARHADMPQYAMIAPSALTVLSDKLPAHAVTGDESAYLDRLRDELAETSMTFIDLRDILSAAADQTQLYYRTDHHWTTDAAYAAYLALSEEAGLSGAATAYERTLLSDAFSGTLTAQSGFRMSETDELCAYLPEDGVSCVVTYVEEGERKSSVYWPENLALRDKYTVFFNGNHPLVRIETAADSKRCMLVIKDSYANCFIPFLIEDCREIVVVDPRYYTGDLEALMAAEGVTDVLLLYNANTLAADTALKADLT